MFKSTLIWLTSGVIILSACSGNTDLKEKKSQLESLKNELKTIQGKINQLEKEISSLDTGATNDKIKSVKVSAVKLSDFDHFVEIQGMLESEENILVHPKMGGLITSVLVQEGQHVTAGQVLATIDNATIVSSLEEIENQLELATTVYEKQKRLWEQNIGTELQFLQAKNNKTSLEKRRTTIQNQLDMSKIIAPFSGIVDEVNIHAGETAAPGFGGIRVINMNKLKIVAKVADAYASTLKKGNRVIVTLPDIGKTFESQITYTALNVSPNSRTFNIEVKIPAGIENLRPNLLARLSVNDISLKNVIAVPLNLLQKSPEGHFTLMATSVTDGKKIASVKTVKTGISYENSIVIEEGLKPGDAVIIAGNEDLIDGQEVQIIP